jgi:thiol-disulfide isomerase/thioredoxin
VRVPPCLLLAACLCLGSLGCASAAKRANTTTPTSTPTQARAAADAADPLVSHATTEDQYGMLAGRVIDLGSGAPVDAYVRWECLNDPKEKSGDVEARSGYFTIQGCKAGKQYKLIARAKRGDRLVAGTSFVTAPNVNIFIKMSESFVTQQTPPLPGPPVPGDKSAETPKDLKKTGGQERSGWGPGIGSIAVPTPPPDTQPFLRPLAPQPPAQPTYPDGLVRIPPSVAQGTPAPTPTVTAPPPSCNLMGNQVGGRLYNLALRDLEGNVWEWRTNRRGKVVLLDFWKTSCPPCRAAIGNLKALQAAYGPVGLEVIGIACEPDGTPQEQALRVALLCRAQQTNYRLLLAGGLHNPVPDQFGVRYLPTLFLLDENGTILWIHEGGLSRDDDAVLRRQIERALNVQRQ